MDKKDVIRICNNIVNTVLVLTLLMCVCYAAYGLWNNKHVLNAAQKVRAEMITLKPLTAASETKEDIAAPENTAFVDLQAVNPDVVAWLTMDNTNIDFPVLQGINNMTYFNRDVYGNPALAGSIFLDSRNNSTFSDRYNLMYGHHMNEGNMFGDLDLYKDEDFFTQNTTGTLVLPEQTYRLEVICCMIISATDGYIFDPEGVGNSIDDLWDYIQQKSIFIHDKTFLDARSASDAQFLALSTCATDYPDARTILLTQMNPI